MRGKRDYSGYQVVYLEPEITHCPKCGHSLQRAYRSDRHVAFLGGGQEILYEARRCPKTTCAGEDNRYLPAELHLVALRKFEYGFDVVAWIGQRRLKHHVAFPTLAEILRRDHGVSISDRRVQDLFDVYLALTSTEVTKDPKRLAALQAQGRIILALDAAQPEADGESLWVFRDTISGEILKGFTASGMDAATLAVHLREVKALGIPVEGVLSDAQNIILTAVQEVFAGVPHQLCHLHFLRDFAKAVTEADQALKTDLGKQLRGLVPFERAAAENPPKKPKATALRAPKSVTLSEEPAAAKKSGRPRTHVRLKPPRTAQERRLVLDVCEVLRAVLKERGRYPLDAPGLKTYDLLKKVRDALEEGIKKGEMDFSCLASFASMSTSR